LPEGIAGGNGRLEATTIDVAAKSGGRLLSVRVREGDFVSAGDEIARMDTQSLDAQLRGAQAQLRQARTARATLTALVRQREQAVTTVASLVAQREAEAALAEKELRRTSELVSQKFFSPQQLDAANARVQASRAALSAARSQRIEAESAVLTARSQIVESEAAIESAQAAADRIQVEIADAVLRAPRGGRVQTVLAQGGEVLAGGGRVVSLVDLSDVTMNFFLPETAAGRVAIGAEARLGRLVAQDHMARRIGHETGRRIVGHQPECIQSRPVAAQPRQIRPGRQSQGQHHQHDPDEGWQGPAFAQQGRPGGDQAQPNGCQCQQAVPPAAIQLHPTRQNGSPAPACALPPRSTMVASG